MKVRPGLIIMMDYYLQTVGTESEDAALEAILDALETCEMTAEEAWDMYDTVKGLRVDEE